MFRWIRRRFQRPVVLTDRERELLDRENDESRRQAMGETRSPISRFIGIGSGNKGWLGRIADRHVLEKRAPVTQREREALIRENDEARRQAMADPAYGISTAGGRAAGNYFVSTNDSLSRAPEEVSKDRGDRPARPNN